MTVIKSPHMTGQLRRRTLASEDVDAWEAYRLYQRDLLAGCFEDADLMLKRTKQTDAEDRRLVVSLLWEKRCQPW
ncbi:MAG TPA: hypothetical protein VNX21_01425, partial [Candidatus Thermoplasmatota archaeon]|nr:hypothetical protein [Candidatus Thermoplasmatota archaeon]